MIRVRILGISGSPRHGNTELLVKEALRAAEGLGGVETEFVSLADKTIDHCKSCYDCFKNPSREKLCYRSYETKNDVNEILNKMIVADGLIVGSPVYFGVVSSKLKALIDRAMPLEALGLLLRNKVGGAIAVAHERSGGLEETVKYLNNWFLFNDAIVVSVGPERPMEGIVGYSGAMAVEGWPSPKIPWEDVTAVREDKQGIYATRCLGKRVAEVAKIIKAGLAQVPKNEMAWPLP